MNDTMKRVLKTLAVLGVVIIAIIICMLIRSCRAEVEDPDATHTTSKEPTVEISNEPSNPPTESSVPTQEPIETRPPVEPTIEPTVEPTVNPTQKPVQSKPQVTVTVPPVNTEPQPTGSPNPTTEPGKSAVIVINDKASFYGDPLQKLDFTIVSGNATYDEIANAITLEKEPGTDAGEYKINGTYKSGNTTITVIGGATYTILPRPITVKVYNRSSYKGQSLETLKYELTKGTIAIGDSLKEVITLSTEADKNNVGKYPIKLHANKNYKVTWTDELGQVIKEAVYEVKAYRPVDPTDPPVRPTVRPTRPPVNPTDPPVNPTVKPTDPPVNPTVKPTDPPVDPTVKPTDPPVDPTDPPVDPTVKPTDKIDTGTGDGGFGTGGGQGNVGGGNGQTGTGDGGFGTGGGQGTVGGGNGQTGTGDGGFGTGGGQGTVGGGNTQGGNGDGGFGTGGGQGTVGG